MLQDGEAAVVRRERAAGKLRLAPYFMGNVLAELQLNLLLPVLLTAVIHHMAGLAGPLPQMALLVSLETVAANALGLLVGASAPSLDIGLEAAKAIGTIATVFGATSAIAVTIQARGCAAPPTPASRDPWPPLTVRAAAVLCVRQAACISMKARCHGRCAGWLGPHSSG